MAAPTPIDRDKTTPSLLRVFYRLDGHNSEMAFGRDVFPSNELHFYTWPDATLKELSELLKDVVGPARKRVARLEFALVYPNKEGRYRLRQLGIVRNSARGPDDAKTLKELNYQIGDYLDIAVMIGNEGPRGRGGPGEFGGRRDGEFGGRRDGEFGGRRDGEFGGRRDGEFGGRREGGPQGGYGGGPSGARGGEERGNTRDNAGYGSFAGAQRGRGNYSER